MIKAIFLDIDGTLVPFGDHEPPREVIKALAEVRRKGVKVFIATGRQINWVVNLGDLEVDGYMTVNGNVCLMPDRKTIISKNLFTPGDVDRVIDFSHRCELPIVMVPPLDPIVINKVDPNVVASSKLLSLPPVPVIDLEEMRGKEIAQMMLFGSDKERLDSGFFSPEVLQHAEATSWNDLFCDVIPAGSSKAMGIDEMIHHFGIDLSETMAFGDGGNDIEMLQHAAIGVAMGQSVDKVKSAADYVTDAVDDHGLVNALRHFSLI